MGRSVGGLVARTAGASVAVGWRVVERLQNQRGYGGVYVPGRDRTEPLRYGGAPDKTGTQGTVRAGGRAGQKRVFGRVAKAADTKSMRVRH